MILEKDDIALVNTNYSCIERRCSPRIDTVFKVKFADNTIGNILNINEAGACIVSPKSIDSKTVPVEIILFPKPITLKVHLIWSKKDSENNGFIHGLKFINLPKGALPLIMRSLIYRQLRSVIKNIKDKKARSEIVKFAKCFKQYLFDLFDLSHDLEKNKVSQENALHKLTDLTNKIMEKGDLLELRLANRVLIKKIKQNFRTLVSSWAYKSFIVKRSLDKPRGYPGDYKIIETIYDKALLSTKIGLCFDQYFQQNAYAKAVRSRKDKMRDILNEIIFSSKNNMKILNIACGSNREIRELLLSNKDHSFKKQIQFNLLDQDKEALEFSRQHLPSLPNIRYNFINDNVVNIMKEPEKYKKDLEYQDLIYSIGLADYLPDRILGTLLGALFTLLKNNGQLIIAHKDITKYRPLPPNWFCDWNFFSRDKRALLNLLKKYTHISDNDIKMDYEKTSYILFFVLTKRN